jgi:FkbM family methyltransferase
MRLVSYAQNFEDVMLWRALKDVSAGCYIDVGAQHPVVDSVSRFFYEQGWRGVHIEPVPEYAALLREDRPDETVLEIALGASNAQLTLNVIPGTGLSTGVAAYAESHAGRQGLQSRAIQAPCTTLASALSFMAGREIHWLKIDVEGMEEDVLQGWDSQALRPWIILVEATVPISQEASHATWEPLLEQANYRFVYFDGLNRFYVAAEHARLSASFLAPPNVFDGFELSGQASAAWCKGVQARACELGSLAARSHEELQVKTRQIDLLEAELAQVRRELVTAKSIHARETEKLQVALKQSQQESDQISAQLQSVYESRLWRMTGLIRKPVHVGKTIVKSGSAMAKNPKQATRQAVRSGMVWAMRGVLARPHIQNRAMELLSRYPSVKQRLRLLAIRTGLIANSQTSAAIDNPLAVTIDEGKICMPARTAAIFKALKQAVEERNQ